MKGRDELKESAKELIELFHEYELSTNAVLFLKELELRPTVYRKICASVPVGESIYGLPYRCDFMVADHKKWPNGLAIKILEQEGSGSVDQKYPFMVLCAKQAGHPFVFITYGDGHRKQAITWLKKQVDEEYILAVVDWQEFHLFAKEYIL